jgi:hypothetical protein
MDGPLVPINGVTAFTPAFDSSTRTNYSVNPALAVEVTLAGVSYPMRGDKEVSGIVTAVQSPTSGNSAIPAGGLVLSAWGATRSEILAHAKVGDRIRVRIASGAEEFNNADNALTGIGWVIHDGAAYPAGWTNLESGAYVTSRAPRSVMAWNNTQWFQVVCDGRSGVSVGMTFQEMADFLIGTLGAREAVNYDGGGSATMVVNGTIRNVPSDGSERLVADAIMLVKRNVATAFPVADTFPATGRGAGWDDKFSYCDVVPFSPTSPNGDGYALKVVNPLGGVETTRRGDFGDADYSVAADIYCEYRPGDAADGFERYALFARDSGTGALGLTNYGGGNCYALTYDSSTGRVQAGKYLNGALTDLAPAPVYMPSTAWRRFEVDCQGPNIKYYVDGSLVCAAVDPTFTRGYFGLGYHEFFATDANCHGTRADNFLADQLGGLPQAATGPLPVDHAANVSIHPQLKWTAGGGTTGHDVYFGTTSPGTFRGRQTSTSWDPGPLQMGTRYYWRIDESNENGITAGSVWSFDTQYYLGDMDNDLDVDQEDFGPLQACLTGTGIAQTNPACAKANLDGDTDVDMDDVTLFLACQSGPGRTPPASCVTGS